MMAVAFASDSNPKGRLCRSAAQSGFELEVKDSRPATGRVPVSSAPRSPEAAQQG